jgi:hypothetical protein
LCGGLFQADQIQQMADNIEYQSKPGTKNRKIMENVIKSSEFMNDQNVKQFQAILKQFEGLSVREACYFLERLRGVIVLKSRVKVNERN